MKVSEHINDGASTPAAGATEATQVDDVINRFSINAGLLDIDYIEHRLLKTHLAAASATFHYHIYNYTKSEGFIRGKRVTTRGHPQPYRRSLLCYRPSIQEYALFLKTPCRSSLGTPLMVNHSRTPIVVDDSRCSALGCVLEVKVDVRLPQPKDDNTAIDRKRRLRRRRRASKSLGSHKFPSFNPHKRIHFPKDNAGESTPKLGGEAR
ncbi:hypothetical protein EVAR_65297_1 [Eumeta japonica]|uniref:Uncharacterized protein n=1 Tax=Eumeta variegata TaxID=151549 RepID=A0A4C2AED3_EUMVA|nr:hypothetical protein EVAR_65297_1 [Eumeta japonica]